MSDDSAFLRAAAQAPCGLLSFSDDGVIAFANERVHAWVGSANGALVGRHLDRLLAPASRVFHSTHFFPLLKLHGRADEIHLILRDEAGGDVPVMVSAVREARDVGALNHCAILTMPGRKALEKALVDAREAAQSASLAKDVFLAEVSHELRTPLSTISMWVTALRSGKLDATQQRRAIDAIQRSTETQSQLVEDLIDVSRIESGSMRIHLRPTDLAPVLEGAVDIAKQSAYAKGIAVVSSIDARAGVVHADATRIQQIASNLLTNAVKFTPKGGRIDVEFARVGSHVQFIVADTGIGIEAAQVPFLFDRFWQADRTSHRAHSGLGLGLSIVKRLVELHGGTIRAESDGTGQGASFIVALPLAAVEPATRGGALGRVRSDFSPDPASLRGLRIVLVDDDPRERDVFALLLQQAGASVEALASANGALRRIEAHAPNIVIANIALAGKSGFDFITELRQMRTEASIVAIALDEASGADDRVRVLQAGFQAHLAKPVDPEEAIALIRALARTRQRPQ